jgi:hypothetical protein
MGKLFEEPASLALVATGLFVLQAVTGFQVLWLLLVVLSRSSSVRSSTRPVRPFRAPPGATTAIRAEPAPRMWALTAA